MDALMALTRPVEDAVLFGAAGFLLKASRDSEANDRVAAIRAAADAVGYYAVAICIQLPPRIRQAEPVSSLSQHHSHALPLISWMPSSFASFCPRGWARP